MAIRAEKGEGVCGVCVLHASWLEGKQLPHKACITGMVKPQSLPLGSGLDGWQLAFRV